MGICQDYDPCPNCGRRVFTTPSKKRDGAVPHNCPCRGETGQNFWPDELTTYGKKK